MTDPASFDEFVDPQVGALVTLCKGAVNANVVLAPGAADMMVREAYPWPVPRKMLSATELPILLIYRSGETLVQRTTLSPVEHKVIFTFEYVMPIVGDARAGLRWGALTYVWNELVRVVADGHDPAVAGNAAILTAAGFMDIDETERGRRVDFEKPRPDADVFPSFVGAMLLSHRDEYDLSALQDLVDLDAQYRLVNGGASDQLLENEQPLVAQILTKPA